MKMPAWMLSLVIFPLLFSAHAAERNTPAAAVLRISALASAIALAYALRLLGQGPAPAVAATRGLLDAAIRSGSP